MRPLLALLALACGSARADDNVTIPDAFDTRAQWFGCGMNVVDQGQCGSCWAASAASVFGDRACVWLGENGEALPGSGTSHTNRLFQKAGQCVADLHQEHDHGCKRTAQFVSPQALLSCASFAADPKLYPDSAGCGGGWSIDAWRYMHRTGLPTMTADGASGCAPYTSGHCHGKDPHGNGCKACAGVVDQCEDSGQAPTLYRVKSFGVIHDKDLRARSNTSLPRPESDRVALDRQVRAMQMEIMRNGPVQACIDYFSNFGLFFNKSPLGVYNSTERHPVIGAHCLNVIGWGRDANAEGMPFWLVKNSWGPNWGSEGVFRFVRGADLAGFESDVYAGCPADSNCELTENVIRKDAEPTEELLLVADGNGALRGAQGSLGGAEKSGSTARGGFWVDMSREAFSAPEFAMHVAHAYEQAFGKPTTPERAARAAQRVQAQGGVRGFRLNVQFAGAEQEVLVHRM